MINMKICTFCGYQAENSAKVCTSCGSKQFNYICPNCSKEFEGKFCPACGTNFNAVAKTCPKCGRKYFSKACPDCGYSEFMETHQVPVTSAARTGTAAGPANSRALMAFVLSMLGIIMMLPPVSVIGLVFAIRERKNEELDPRSKRYCDLAMLMGISGIVLVVVFAVIYVSYYAVRMIQ